MKTRFGDINIVGNVENKGSVIGPQEFALTVTVGTNGDFPTINSALTELSRKYPVYKHGGFSVQVRLLAGYVMNEYVNVNSVDMSWITITGEDAETTIVRSVILTMGAFYVAMGGKLPRIGQLFNMDSSGVGTNRHGIFLNRGGFVHVDANCGVKNAGGNGLFVSAGSNAIARDTIFTGAGIRGVQLGFSSIADVTGINASGAGVDGILASYGSIIVARAANARKGATDSTTDIRVLDLSFIDATSSIGGVSQTAGTYTTHGMIRK